MPSTPSQENRQIRLDRIVEVLELASATDEGIPLMDVVAGLGIPRATAYRLLAEMRRVGMLEAVNGRGPHRLTKKFAAIGTAAQRNRQLFSRVEKYFSKLSDELEETTYLVQISGRVISLVGYAKPINTSGLHPGYAFPIHASAAGKILWSYQNAEILDVELARPHVKFQDKTHVEEADIRAELNKAKTQGYGTHDEEWDKGVFTMALPLFLGRKTPSMALGIMAIKERLLTTYTEQEIYQRLRWLRDTVDPILGQI